MTDQELDNLIQEMKEGIEKLSGKDQPPLTKAQKNEKGLLMAKHDTLVRIKSARERRESNTEFNNIVFYGALNSWAGKNAILRHFARLRLRQNIF
ncbi:MAG: hypothetical protein PHR43_01915 [Dehalococcoidales bacterium]|nr:hypothetical protein [Dehalococcoidales bacterium]